MNRECWGDAFMVAGRRYYRCFRDGAVLPGEVAPGQTCPNCGRAVVKVKEQGEVKTRLCAVLDGRVLAPLPIEEEGDDV